MTEAFETIRMEGKLFTSDHLVRIKAGDLPGITAKDYGRRGGRLEEEISRHWTGLEASWGVFQAMLSNDESRAYEQIRDYWLVRILDALGFGSALVEGKPRVIEGKAYKILFEKEGVPIHIVAATQDLEKGPDGTARGNPHSHLQEYLNRCEDKTWGILTNGLKIRVLRDNAASKGAQYVEFDLQAMMSGQHFHEFGIFWRLMHVTRFTGDEPWIEKWMRESARQGVRAHKDLKEGVVKAIVALGNGFMDHRRSNISRKIVGGELDKQDFYHELLRLVYRLLFLFVTEDRDLLLQPDSEATRKQRRMYMEHYSTQRLRRLARRSRGSKHHDAYEQLKVVMDGLKRGNGIPELALPGLNSDLWNPGFIPTLEENTISNEALYEAIRHLSVTKKGKQYHAIDYVHLDSEELGGIYETLLELHPVIGAGRRSFDLDVSAEGNERRTSGSHYTPTDLIDKVLDHALDPLLDEAQAKDQPEKALLELTVCDPTCGSGHFLIAAARRIAKRVARIRTHEEEPPPEEIRQALRDVIGRCIYGVDINPMAVELCKISLWLEAMVPGKPLTFLESHIKCGNALLGAFPEYLEKGIPDEAYKPRPGIDKKEVCTELKKINKQVPMTQETLKHFKEDRKRIQDYLAQTLEEIEAMPTDTVEQIEAKEEAYRTRYLETHEYERYKLALDAWCAAFSYPKVSLGSEANIGNPELIDVLQADHELSDSLLEVVQTGLAQLAFFHWNAEFPQVFRSGGFACLVGNPPYMGGSRIRSQLGPEYLHYFDAAFEGHPAMADLAAAVVLRCSQLSSSSGRIGLVTTNSISKGVTRTVGLSKLLTNGWSIRAAYPDITWGGAAAVIVALVVLAREAGKSALSGVSVGSISSRLDALPEQDPVKLTSRQRVAFRGDMPNGKEFMVPIEVAQSWLADDPRTSEVVAPFVSGEHLLQKVNQEVERYCICFHDWDESRARTFEKPWRWVVENVAPVRAESKSAKLREVFWQFERYRKRLRQESEELDHVIVRAEISETPLFLRLPKDRLFSKMLIVFASSDWNLVGQLNSGFHEVWYRNQGSAMKHDIRYVGEACFETFPVPNESPEVARLGESFHETVLAHAKTRGIALTPLWNLVNDPECHDADIEEIRSLRNELTVAVAKAFEMPEIDFGFGFYKDHAGRDRYTMSPEAAERVYLELVRLNAEQAAAEQSQPKKGEKSQATLAKGQAKLFGQQQVRLSR